MSESNFADKTSKVTVTLDGEEKIVTVQELIDIAEFHRPSTFWYSEIPSDFTGIAWIIEDDGTAYIKDGKYHCENGPAFIPDDREYASMFYYNGTCYGDSGEWTVESWIEFIAGGLQLED